MKIPFDIKFKPQIESGEYKVICGDNCYPVFILMWDFKDPEGYCILGYYEDKEGQHAVMYNNSGKLYHDKESMFDLFIITPEPELSEFEKKFQKIISDWQGDSSPFEDNMSYLLHKDASELLSLARKELCEQIVDHTKEAYENGKAEALKDLPRWRPAAKAYEGDRLPRIDWSLNRLVARFEEGIYYLDMKELYNLPNCFEES